MTGNERLKRFEQLMLPHFASANNLARWLTRQPDDAHDIVQEAYLRAFRSFDSFHGENSRAWLLTIVRNTFYTWHANQAPHEPYDEDRHGMANDPRTHAEVEDPAELLLRQSEREHLQHMIDALPVTFREVLVLREIEGYSYKEIAEILGAPAGTVMSRLARARALLQGQARRQQSAEAKG
ncbi:MAG: sigma-70 family RNA polymerase sigma factor [Wenzhouxiangella sp.]